MVSVFNGIHFSNFISCRQGRNEQNGYTWKRGCLWRRLTDSKWRGNWSLSDVNLSSSGKMSVKPAARVSNRSCAIGEFRIFRYNINIEQRVQYYLHVERNFQVFWKHVLHASLPVSAASMAAFVEKMKAQNMTNPVVLNLLPCDFIFVPAKTLSQEYQCKRKGLRNEGHWLEYLTALNLSWFH